MATPFQNPSGSFTNQSATDFEPDEQWKSRLKVDIETNLHSMVVEAKQNLHNTLKKCPVSAVERQRLTEEYLATMRNIRNLAEEQFRISLERERQVRRWSTGQVLDQEWSDTIRKEQQAILDNIERKRKDNATYSSSSQLIADPLISRSSRSSERVWTPHEHAESEHGTDYFPRSPSREFEEDHLPPLRNTGKARAGSVSSAVGSYKPPSTSDTTDRGVERPKSSPTIDEPDDIPRSARPAMDVQDGIRRGSRAGISTRQLPEIWLPSITPEQDAQMSRPFSIARRGSTTSTTSSYRAPPVLNTPFSYEPHDSTMEKERERISAMKQEWSSMDRARYGERTTSYTHAKARASVTTTPQLLDERYSPPLPSVVPIISSAIPYTYPVESPSSTVPIAYARPAHSPSFTAPISYTRSSDSSRPHAPPPIASRPIVTKQSFTFDDGDFQASPSPKGWTDPSRSPYDTNYETSCSPQTSEEIPQNWQPSNFRAGPSSDMRYGYNVGETGYCAAQPVHTYHEMSEGEHNVDLDDTEWEYDEMSEGEYDEVSEGEYHMDFDDVESWEYDEGRMPQREASVSLGKEEVAQPEQELRREKNTRRGAKLMEELRSDDKQKVQQDEFRKREEKKKQEKFKWESCNRCPSETSRPTPPPKMATSQSQSSSSSTGPWPIANHSDRSIPGPSPPTDRSSFGSTSTGRSSAAWTSSTRSKNSTGSSHPPSTPKPSAHQNAKTTLGPPPTPVSEAEFHRHHAEQARHREEQFRQEQAKLEQERLLKEAKLHVDTSTIKIFEHHRGQWARLQMAGVLIWDNFPWPVFKRSSCPDDITTPDITAYMLSSLHPIDKSPRLRVKENIRWWHHDRFETHLLPRVKESDRDSVREAASTVARTLYHLLHSDMLMQDSDVSTPSSRIIILEPPILLAHQNTDAPSYPIYTSITATQISTSPSPEATATVEEASRELPDSVSDSLEDLTNELQGKSSFPAASGGFGDIWKCILVKANENVDVAVKTIRAFETDGEELVRKNARRVRRELKVWGRLKHHSILPLWGVANDFGPYPAMVCPWAENGALTSYLERQQTTLSSQDKFFLLNDIALGLQYLHSKSVVHGDLTGSNVLISGNGRACLADFGLSTIILEFVGTSYFTSSIRGNVRWVAAELCEILEDDELSLSTECDIYSFGSITLQVLTCKVPYYNVKKDIAVLGQVIKGVKPEPPKESQIAPGHWEFMQRCWLPRASRPSIAEIVTFIACEWQVVSS